GQLEQSLGPGEQHAAEIRRDPEAVHVDTRLVRELRQLLDLLRGQELGLVDDQVVDVFTSLPRLPHHRPHIGVGFHFQGLPCDTDPAGDLSVARPVVPDQQQPLSALTSQVVVDLQCQRRLATVHRTVGELHFARHRQLSSPHGARNGGEGIGRVGVVVMQGHDEAPYPYGVPRSHDTKETDTERPRVLGVFRCLHCLRSPSATAPTAPDCPRPRSRAAPGSAPPGRIRPRRTPATRGWSTGTTRWPAPPPRTPAAPARTYPVHRSRTASSTALPCPAGSSG